MLQKKLRSHRTQPVAALYARWVLGTLARAEAVSAENECPTLEQFQVYFLCSSSSSSCSCSCCYCCCPLLLDLRKPFDLKCDPGCCTLAVEASKGKWTLSNVNGGSRQLCHSSQSFGGHI